MMPTRSDCEAVVRHLWPYLDGVVADNQHAFIAAHLALCVNCSAHFDFARAFLQALAATRSRLPVDERLHARVIGALAESGFSLGGDGDTLGA